MSSHVAAPSIAMGMSKLAMNRFVEYLAVAYGKEGLMSYALHPGGVKTAMSQDPTKVPPDLSASKSSGIEPKILSKHRLETPADTNVMVGCTDTPEMSAVMAVWLAREKRPWLNGRYVASNWDTNELETKMEEIEQGDKLKFRMVV